MEIAKLITMAFVVCLVAASAIHGAEISNEFAKVTVNGASITSLRAGPHKISFIKDLKPEFWREAPETHVEVTGTRAVVSPFEERRWETIATHGGTNEPEKLLPGHTLAQTFTVPERCTFASVSAQLPTWNTSDSGATISLHTSSGKLIASRKLTNVPDGSWQSIESDTVLGPGVYMVRISDPVGTIGWWGSPTDVLGNGEALADGAAAPGDRRIQLTCERHTGTGSLSVSLEGRTISVEASLKPVSDEKFTTFPWRWKTTWTKDGYDCTPKAGVVFSRFYTDNLRYMPIQQLKRRDHGGLSFDGSKWIEMDGAADADLRLSSDKLHLHWEMQPDEMSLRFDTPMQREGDVWKTSFSVEVKDRDDSVPAEFPHFACSDAKLEADLNRFWWERGFSYAAPSNRSVEWSEWSAIMRAWFAGLRDNEIATLLDYPITDEGYVHTYGNIVGWPLVPKRDTRHFDSNARFILGCWRNYLWTGDLGFLEKQSARLQVAMKYQLETLQGKDGLIITPSFKTGKHEDLSNNYWDILPFGHLDAYANIVFYGSLTAMEQIDKALGAASLADYAALRKLAHSRYDEVFWDEQKGRYIGCVDSEGVRHDYGFTFINLEALYYGLGDQAKARRIYHWMETEPTSTGKADTYSKFAFAPRSNTIHNPMWGPKAPAEELASPVKPWWTYWWHGTPYGDQVQDGGAILFVSFFDLMDRARHISADNAWERFMQIMKRYRLPDRLSGGSPLYTGEIPQQENAGGAGVDYPFPESGLVPLYFFYGVIGVEAAPEGLRITPNLPEALTYAEVSGIDWRGEKLRVRVTPTTVEVQGGTIERKYQIKQGESVLVTKQQP